MVIKEAIFSYDLMKGGIGLSVVGVALVAWSVYPHSSLSDVQTILLVVVLQVATLLIAAGAVVWVVGWSFGRMDDD